FKIELEMVLQAIFAQEIQAGCCIRVILVLGWFFRLGFNVKLAFESDLPLVVDCHMQKTAEMIQFTLHVCVPQGRITLAAAPEYIPVTSQFMGHFDRFFDLCTCVGEYVGIATGRGPMTVT